MARRKQVLFIQLPQLDNDIQGETENVPLAAAYLQYAAEQAGEDKHYEFTRLPEPALDADNATLLTTVIALNPSVIACTLYLWNIERTLRLMRSIRRTIPHVRIVIGGPEAAYSHPFLYSHPIADAIVIGEGESVFPALLRSFRTGKPASFSTVSQLTPQGYRLGTTPTPPVSLSSQIPPPGYDACRPNRKGMAYLETSRGCPMRCTYCRYPHLRHRMSFLEPADIIARVKALRKLGAREIRFVDPTFNSHPRFREIIRSLARLNRAGRLSFFAELNAERLTDEEADQLAAANFVEIEVGVQSRDPQVLAVIRRPTSLARLDAGIQRLTRRRIKVTVDIMYGLPLQNLADVQHSVAWALKLRQANVQCLQTLLLPGTELRDRHHQWQIRAQSRPPYGVTQTSTMDATTFKTIESLISSHSRLRSDITTPRFVGKKLDLFSERISMDGEPAFAKGTRNRRAYLIDGANLFGCQNQLARFIKNTITHEPDCLFQFVLCPRDEEPLDLLDTLIRTIRSQASHLNDRYASVALDAKIASRRLMVMLPRTGRFSREWIEEAEELLSAAFF